MAQRYGFRPDQAWLDHVRLSSVRLARGCSGSFASPNGLVMTNHHCAQRCLQQLSSKKRDYMADGFSAREGKDEVRCSEIEINQLVDISDVTAQVGLVFDGNIHSLGGDYWYDEISNRMVALHSSAIREALDKIYGAKRLRDEPIGGTNP